MEQTIVLQILHNDYTTLAITQGAKVNVGKAMKELGVETISRLMVGIMLGLMVGMMVGLSPGLPSFFPLFTRVSEDPW